jgi:hypothetical protein
VVKEESSFLKKRSKRLLILRQRQHTGHGRDLGSGGELKVFWFFSSEKNKSLLLSSEKEAKRLLFPARRFQRYGTWPESDCK